MYVRHAQCCNHDCPYSHLSQDQVKRALGQGGSEQRDTSRWSNDADKDSRGCGKGKCKGKRGKKGDPSPSRGKEKDVKSTPVELELQQVRSRPRWCPANLKGKCQKGDTCPYPHLDGDAVSEIKLSDKRRKEQEKENKSD